MKVGYRISDPSKVGPEELVRYLGALLRLAALDGVAPEQETFVQRVVADLGLDAGAVERARGLAGDQGVPTEALIRDVTDDGLRIALLRDAYQLAAVDGTVTAGEIEELGSLAAALGVGSETAGIVAEIFAVTPPRAAPSPRPQAGEEPPEAAPLAAEIAAAPGIEPLALAAARIQDLGRRLVADRAPPERITSVLAGLNDRVNVRIVELETARAGLEDVDFCWIALGSQGRSEQTLATDQDNGIVFAASTSSGTSRWRRAARRRGRST